MSRKKKLMDETATSHKGVPVDSSPSPTIDTKGTIGHPNDSVQGVSEPVSPIQEAKEYKKRGRKPKQEKVKITQAESAMLLTPLFQFGSMIMQARGIKGLDESEIRMGIDAWHPILEKYIPTLGEWVIWIPPITWTGMVITARLGSSEPQPEESKKEVENVRKSDTDNKASK